METEIEETTSTDAPPLKGVDNKTGQFETASCWVVLDRTGSNVFLPQVTPPEAVLLKKMHQPNTGNNPVTKLKITGTATMITARETETVTHENSKGEVEYSYTQEKVTGVRPRTQADEIRRLRWKYGSISVKGGGTLIEKCFPGEFPTLPTTFSEVGMAVGAEWNAFPTEGQVSNPKTDQAYITTRMDESDFAFVAMKE